MAPRKDRNRQDSEQQWEEFRLLESGFLSDEGLA